jgi:hypothetical protein
LQVRRVGSVRLKKTTTAQANAQKFRKRSINVNLFKRGLNSNRIEYRTHFFNIVTK